MRYHLFLLLNVIFRINKDGTEQVMSPNSGWKQLKSLTSFFFF